jgi:hypothetical protein
MIPGEEEGRAQWVGSERVGSSEGEVESELGCEVLDDPPRHGLGLGFAVAAKNGSPRCNTGARHFRFQVFNDYLAPASQREIV